MGSRAGVMTAAAKRCGLDPEEYALHLMMGEKFCWKCRTWKVRAAFSRDGSRTDGLKPICIDCDRVPVKRQRKLRRPSEREGNRATEAVRGATEKGILPPIESQLCVRCSAPARHYHHYAGYEELHLLDVIPMCASCHRKEHWDG